MLKVRVLPPQPLSCYSCRRRCFGICRYRVYPVAHCDFVKRVSAVGPASARQTVPKTATHVVRDPAGREPVACCEFESHHAHQFGVLVPYGAGAACKAVGSGSILRHSTSCESGQIGKGATFRPWRFCGFDSHLSHQFRACRPTGRVSRLKPGPVRVRISSRAPSEG